ncbi:MAG: carboxypeptidase M32 [Candidatus Bipolaricaulia bacterium]
MEELKRFKEYVREMGKLGSAAALLNWDQQTYIPRRGHEARAEVLGKLARLAFEMLISPQMAEFIEKLDRPEVKAGLSEQDRAMIRVVAKEHRRKKAIPPELYEQFVITTSKAHSVWEEARAKSDFSLFKPYLEKIVAFVRQFAELYGYKENPYDALLEDYEPGLTARELKGIIEPLQRELVPFLQRLIEEGEPPRRDFLKGTFSTKKQEELTLRALRAMGYDFEAGRQDTTAHPFTITIGPGDVRVTTRFDPKDLLSALFSSIHEGGHALYDQGIAPELRWTGLDEGASMGLHESQSRTWENLVGRSLPFWEFFYPNLQELFPRFKQVPLDDFYRAVNYVEPSFIRVEADEVTYNLHIMLRFELEEGLLNKRIEAEELPPLWNESMKRYLGIVPPNDAKGVLQDVHWSAGSFGYFPSYMLGNLYAAQLFQAAEREIPDLWGKIAKGELRPLREWQQEKIHKFGKIYEPKELLEKVTGEGPNPQHFLRYIKAKFGEVYRLQSS